MPVGEQTYTLEYIPGQPRPSLPPIEEGDYQLILVDFGKDGPAGWRQTAPNKFPFRTIRFAIANTEDTLRGGERRCKVVVSLQYPFVLRIHDVAEAAAYPMPIKVTGSKQLNDPANREVAAEIDKVLTWIKDNGVVLNANLKNGEFKGRPFIEVDHFLPPTTQFATETASNEDVPQGFDADAVFASMQVKTKNAKQARK